MIRVLSMSHLLLQILQRATVLGFQPLTTYAFNAVLPAVHKSSL